MKIVRKNVEINSSSMADIAFLLLIFFLMTTTISVDKGLALMLPPERKHHEPVARIKERNLFKILVNSQNRILVENEPVNSIDGLRNQVREFVLNPTGDENLAVTPEDAVVSIKTDRGTKYAIYIAILDEVQAAYYEIYAGRAGLTSEEFRQLDKQNPEQRRIYENARKGIPMNISFAEPTNYKGS
jgi:biopolymer transport protein ExbD